MLSSHNITKEEILSKISEEEIFEKYLGIKPVFSFSFKNPFRIDNHADCKFYISESTGMLKFHDIPMKWNWDCFNIVMIKYKCNFHEALEIISEDFNLKSKTKKVNYLKERETKILESKVKKSEIKVNIRKWRKIDVKFWKQFNIDRDILNFYNVTPIDSAFYNDYRIYKDDFTDSDIGYCYYLGNEKIKLYFPFRNKNNKKPRFYHNDSFSLQGARQLPINNDYIIITKSLKDVMSMYSFGLIAIAPASENIIVRDYQIKKIRERFPIIFTLYDNDRTGKIMSKRMRDTYNTIPLLFDKDLPKDFADNVKEFGVNEIIDFIEHYKKLLL